VCAAESREKVASGERHLSPPDAPSHTGPPVYSRMKALFMLTVVRTTKSLLLLADTEPNLFAKNVTVIVKAQKTPWERPSL
jgi:hypothetical protein